MAINRAIQESFERNNIYKSADSCIFISHKSSDKEWAIKLGEHIKNVYNIDIYLDIYDKGLQVATLLDDHHKIVEHIQKGISLSTHLMCLISESTNPSWWVPYEIGYAKKSSKRISSLKIKNISDVPSFLKIEDVLMGAKSLNEYLKKINPYRAINDMYEFNKSKYPINDYLDWK